MSLELARSNPSLVCCDFYLRFLLNRTLFLFRLGANKSLALFFVVLRTFFFRIQSTTCLAQNALDLRLIFILQIQHVQERRVIILPQTAQVKLLPVITKSLWEVLVVIPLLSLHDLICSKC